MRFEDICNNVAAAAIAIMLVVFAIGGVVGLLVFIRHTGIFQ